MNFSNSSSVARQDQALSTKKPFTFGSDLRDHQLVCLTVLSLLLLLLFILIFLLVTQYQRKKRGEIRRKGVIIKRNPLPTADDPQSTLLNQDPAKTIAGIRCLGDMFISDPKTTDISSDTPRYSTISMTNNAINEKNDIDDISTLELSSIPLDSHNDRSPPRAAERSSSSSLENIYIKALQERATAAQLRPRPSVSISSASSSENSCH